MNEALILISLLSGAIANLISTKLSIITYAISYNIFIPVSAYLALIAKSEKNSEIVRILSILSKICLLGIALFLTSLLTIQEEEIIINNYLPIADDFLSILGLCLFVTAGFLACLISGDNLTRLLFVIAALCLIISYNKIEQEITYPIDLYGFYEMLFLSCQSVLSLAYLHLVLLSHPQCDGLSGFKYWMTLFAISSLYIFSGHFLYKIDSADFIIASSFHLLYLKSFLVIFMVFFISKKARWILMPILILGIFKDTLMSEKNYIVEYYNSCSNIGIILSIMYYLQNISLKEDSYLLKYARIFFIIYSLSAMAYIMLDIAFVFIQIATILFALICFINMIKTQIKLEKK